MKDSPLSVKITNDQLIISIGINTLAFASAWENGGPVKNPEIEDAQKWAEAIVAEMERDEQEKTIPINGFLDKMIEKAWFAVEDSCL